MSMLRNALLALMLAGGAGACARQTQAIDQSAQPAADAATVQVSNNYALTMDVWAFSGGNRYRLGSVAPGDKASFAVSRGLFPGNTLEIVAQPMGGGRIVRTGAFSLDPGQVLDFTISNELTFSTATVR